MKTESASFSILLSLNSNRLTTGPDAHSSLSMMVMVELNVLIFLEISCISWLSETQTSRKTLWRQWRVVLSRLRRASSVLRITRAIRVMGQSRGVVHAQLLFLSLEKLLTLQMLETAGHSCRLILVRELYLSLLITSQRIQMKLNELKQMGAKCIKIKAWSQILLLVIKLDPKFWLDLIGFSQGGYQSAEQLVILKPKMWDMGEIRML